MKVWEKTVEYYFVKKFLDDDVFLAPLDGKHESWGSDALLSKILKWVILEFKANINSLYKERDKFSDYDAAAQEFAGADDHHVFGSVSSNQFKLHARSYFARTIVRSVNAIFNAGVSLDELKGYLKRLALYKKSKWAGGGGSIPNYDMEARISMDGKIVQCTSLMDFVREHNFALSQSASQDNTPNAPRMS